MRPFVFHSRSEDICVSTSTKLWTCIRSIRLVRKRSIERSIIWIPASLPAVQTLVAIKSESRKCNLAASSPMTPSAGPYIGEESITRPPRLTNRDITSSSCLLFSGVRLTSNTFQVPSPMTGSFSPEEGIARASILDDWVAACARNVGICNSTPAAPAPISLDASRRVRLRPGMLTEVDIIAGQHQQEIPRAGGALKDAYFHVR